MPDEIDITEVDDIVASIGREPRHLIPILQAIQDKYNYLPEEALRRVCSTTDITPGSVAGVSTFYAQFRHRRAGRHMVKVCIGTACHVKGGETVFDTFKRHLGIAEEEDTDGEGLFTVEKVACLGCCMLAPAVMIDDITYGFVEPARVPHVLHDFLESREPAAGTAEVPAGAETEGDIRLCLCSSCVAGGAEAVHQQLLLQVGALGLRAKVKKVGCTGISYQTPLIEIALADGRRFHYGMVKPEDVKSILLRHLRPTNLKRKIGARLSSLLEKLLTDETWEPVTRYSVDLRSGPESLYTSSQVHLATEHCGEMTPLDIDEYIKRDGFSALKRCLTELTPGQVIEQVIESGLRGRGGAGYPTGNKWARVRESKGDLKYLTCNGDEGDPGAFMDRMILESFPFRVIEGIAIASYAVGAREGFMYIRAEYPLALRRVQEALKICEERGFVGRSIMGTEHSLALSVVAGAGAFVCGESTALMAAIEGRRGMPRIRPPHSAQSGLWQKPTLPNNVETYALVPWIIRNGPEAFAALGTEHSKGTKAFALAGEIARGGLIEVPMGVTLRQLVEEIGGGIVNGRTLKAIQVGGPSGGCVPARLADTPVDYEALTSVGAMMGSGGLVVLDDEDCMVDIARYFLAFTQRESCGKCTYCRVGTKRMFDVLDRLCEGKGRKGDIEELEHLGALVAKGSLCGLGKSAPNPVLSTIEHSRDEYEAHVEGRCPARKCKELVAYTITDDCIGCTRCAQQCPVEAIEMRPYEKHEIDIEKCTRCDTCRQACQVDAVKIRDIGESENGVMSAHSAFDGGAHGAQT